jgi:hypothetical protein
MGPKRALLVLFRIARDFHQNIGEAERTVASGSYAQAG